MIIRKQVNERMSRTVVHNNTVYLAGIVSDDKTLDIKGQAARVLAIAEERLAQVEVSKHDILRVEIFVKIFIEILQVLIVFGMNGFQKKIHLHELVWKQIWQV